jgi:hypothetical protein
MASANNILNKIEPTNQEGRGLGTGVFACPPARPERIHMTMIKSIKHSLWLCLLASFTAGLAGAVLAEDTPAIAPQKKAAPAGLAGKIVAVNKRAKTLTVDIQGKVYVFKTSSHLKIEKDGREIQLSQLLPGQAANFVTGLSTDGGLEVVSVTIEANTERSEAAHPTGPPSTVPPVFLPPPPNRPPISPNQ